MPSAGRAAGTGCRPRLYADSAGSIGTADPSAVATTNPATAPTVATVAVHRTSEERTVALALQGAVRAGRGASARWAGVRGRVGPSSVRVGRWIGSTRESLPWPRRDPARNGPSDAGPGRRADRPDGVRRQDGGSCGPGPAVRRRPVACGRAARALLPSGQDVVVTSVGSVAVMPGPARAGLVNASTVAWCRWTPIRRGRRRYLPVTITLVSSRCVEQGEQRHTAWSTESDRAHVCRAAPAAARPPTRRPLCVGLTAQPHRSRAAGVRARGPRASR